MSRKLRHRSHHGVHGEEPEPVDDRQAELEELAYRYWLERGSPDGSSEEDWFRAERELERRDELASRL
ncbi:MAG: DUF2934 domain-containing protein [Acidobacteriota bacterium]|nr:DUF2934 domain-containing protein [Acidobacteriota bacterium]